MEFLDAILSNRTLLIPISAALGVQVFKFVWEAIHRKQFSVRVLLSTGGMPSSHAAMVTSLATAVGTHFGFDSDVFAIATVLALIVMYDARGVRQESGQHARVLNQILREMFSGQPISERELKEFLGHTSMEVFVGGVVGIVYALLVLQFSPYP
jgi:acid phosphatase family membrane protein YuiD